MLAAASGSRGQELGERTRRSMHTEPIAPASPARAAPASHAPRPSRSALIVARRRSLRHRPPTFDAGERICSAATAARPAATAPPMRPQRASTYVNEHHRGRARRHGSALWTRRQCGARTDHGLRVIVEDDLGLRFEQAIAVFIDDASGPAEKQLRLAEPRTRGRTVREAQRRCR